MQRTLIDSFNMRLLSGELGSQHKANLPHTARYYELNYYVMIGGVTHVS